jgi:hypothetical protein
LQYALACYQDSDGKSGSFFFSAKFRQNVKNERENFCQNFPLFLNVSFFKNKKIYIFHSPNPQKMGKF